MALSCWETCVGRFCQAWLVVMAVGSRLLGVPGLIQQGGREAFSHGLWVSDRWEGPLCRLSSSWPAIFPKEQP